MSVEITKTNESAAEGAAQPVTSTAALPFDVANAAGPQAAPSETKAEKKEAEYLLCSDTTSEVIESGSGPEGLSRCRKMMGQIRKCGGQVTIFKALEF